MMLVRLVNDRGLYKHGKLHVFQKAKRTTLSKLLMVFNAEISYIADNAVNIIRLLEMACQNASHTKHNRE